MQIVMWKPAVQEYISLMKLWESSVRATHKFLYEKDIVRYRSILSEFLPMMDIHCAGYNQKLDGFIGITDRKIQALFVHPDARRMGIGKHLVNYAIKKYAIHSVDVNEQNVEALEFYKSLGFQAIGRNETDGAGKPYPILNMNLD